MVDPDRVRSFQQWAQVRWLASKCLIVVIGLLLVQVGVLSATGGFLAGFLSTLGSSPSNPMLYLYPLVGYFAIFLLPVLLSLPLWLPLAWSWREPRRFVVFRRFNLGKDGAALQRVLTDNFSRFGHVFTLADAAIRVPWTVRIPVILGQLAFVNFRPRTVDSANHVQQLRRLLQQRQWLNVNWMVSWRKIFPIRSSDEYWQTCVTTLIEGADLAVVDISIPRDALRWEITNCIRCGLAKRMIFLASQANEQQSRTWLKDMRNALPAVEAIPIYCYSRKGMVDPRFRSIVVNGVAEPATPIQRERLRSLVWRLVSTFTFSAVATAVLFVSCMPYLCGGFTARYSPSQWQVFQAYLFGDADGEGLARLNRDHPESATPGLVHYARSEVEFVREKGLNGLAEIGDRRAIKPLVDIGNSGDPKTRQTAEDALDAVVTRLGPSSGQDYIDVLRSASAATFDRKLYAILENTFKEMNPATFYPLLDAPSRAARFTAALRLAADNDLRTVPVLLEMLRYEETQYTVYILELRSGTETVHPFEYEASEHLRRLSNEGKGKLDVGKLDPFLSNRDTASAYAATIAVSYATFGELQARLRKTQPNTALLSALGQQAAQPDSREAERSAEVLTAVDSAWLVKFLEDADQNVRLDAALALAMRGDAQGLPATLDLLRQKRACGFLEGLSRVGPCYQFQERGELIFEYLARKLPVSGTFPTRLDNKLGDISIYAIIKLADVVARTGGRRYLEIARSQLCKTSGSRPGGLPLSVPELE